MFFRKIPLPLLELLPAIAGKSAPSGTAHWLPSRPPDRKSHRVLKIAIAAGVLAAGGGAMLSGHGEIHLVASSAHLGGAQESAQANRAALLNLQADLSAAMLSTPR